MTLGGKECSDSPEEGHGGHSELNSWGAAGFCRQGNVGGGGGTKRLGMVLRAQSRRGQIAAILRLSRNFSATLHLWFFYASSSSPSWNRLLCLLLGPEKLDLHLPHDPNNSTPRDKPREK